MKKWFSIYLHPHRRSSRLTQDEVGGLLGYADGSLISRIEKGIRDVSLLDAFALQVIFDKTPVELFPALLKEAEEAVMRRAKDLYEELQDMDSVKARKKVEFLNEMCTRAITRLTQ